MKVYEIDVGGAIYWCAGANICDATQALLDMLRAEQYEDEIDEISVKELSLQDACKKTVRCDGEPSLRPLQVVADEYTKASVIACSEWP
jgi:hypothetical protein